MFKNIGASFVSDCFIKLKMYTFFFLIYIVKTIKKLIDFHKIDKT